MCELRDHGDPYDVEAQFYQNEDFNRARRFDRYMNPNRTPRELAIAWAEQERVAIEGYEPETPYQLRQAWEPARAAKMGAPPAGIAA